MQRLCTKLHRPAELWTIRDGEEQSLLKALTPAVDVWRFGCVLSFRHLAAARALCGAAVGMMWPLGVKSTKSWSW